MDLSTVLKYYNRKDIQVAIVSHSASKEIAVRFGDKGFGKRPDTLNYPNDVIELAKQGATSFHASEELWSNPLQLDPSMKPRDIDALRTGWDLVLDIDCPDWEFSRLTAHLFVKALAEHGIRGISCKFSGNKGFHIGVPFEAFPSLCNGKNTAELFPEGPRRIAEYLLDFVSKNYVRVKDGAIVFDDKHPFTLNQLKAKFGNKDFVLRLCTKCNRKISPERKAENEFICPKCESKVVSDTDFMHCSKCKLLMHKVDKQSSLCSCGSDDYISKFNPLSIIEVDTILIAPRHLYRMPYSLHEKSGLVSLPINPPTILDFKKEIAKPENVKVEYNFLDRSAVKAGEAMRLIIQAFDYSHKEEASVDKQREYIAPETAIPEKFFPPCIHNILKGVSDGRKRSVFILVNFLTSCGWGYDDIEKVFNEWNRKNREPLKENLLLGQLRYHKKLRKKFLPPNCDNAMYYRNFGVCTPDSFCPRIRNPVNYAIRKSRNVKKSL